MTEPANKRIQTAPDLATTLDWRAGRTWVAFTGSALAIGCAFATILVAVTALVLEPPSGEASKGDQFIHMNLMFFFFVPLVVFLWHMALRTQRTVSQGIERSEVSSPSTWIGLALDILLHALWLVLAFATCATLARLVGPADYVLETDRAGMFGVLMNLGPVIQRLPPLLHRWARPKAPPSPSPPGQADAGRERRS